MQAIKRFIFDCLSDSSGAWCGARVLIMASGFALVGKFLLGAVAASDLYAGIGALACAYAGKDWSERK